MGRLTAGDFADAVHEVAAVMYRIQSASAHGFTAMSAFSSNSGKCNIDATLQFDEQSGRCHTIICPYTTPNQPRFFADRVRPGCSGRFRSALRWGRTRPCDKT